MTHDEALRLWAYQWVMHGERPRDLPEGVKMVVVDRDATDITYTIWERPLEPEHIDLRKFVLESADTIQMCHAGYGERTKTFVVTPVETQPRYDLPTAEPELPT